MNSVISCGPNLCRDVQDSVVYLACGLCVLRCVCDVMFSLSPCSCVSAAFSPRKRCACCTPCSPSLLLLMLCVPGARSVQLAASSSNLASLGSFTFLHLRANGWEGKPPPLPSSLIKPTRKAPVKGNLEPAQVALEGLCCSSLSTWHTPIVVKHPPPAITA